MEIIQDDIQVRSKDGSPMLKDSARKRPSAMILWRSTWRNEPGRQGAKSKKVHH
jgi:hypothetical protein